MKADGIEYDERMELLDEVTWPKPLEELLEHTYGLYRQRHPWVGEDALSPKSVVRDMYERAMTFGEYVAFYGLTRSEGLVLRYLGDAYRALRQTVPDSVRTDELEDIIEWLGAVVRQTDSSLLDEWEQLNDPDRLAAEAAPDVLPPTPERITANERAFTVLVRNAMFRRVELAALNRWAPLGELEAEAGSIMGAEDWREALEAYFARARQHRHRSRCPRPPDADRREGRARPGRSSRSSVTPTATTTGASWPPSTWPPPTTRASWSSTSRMCCGCRSRFPRAATRSHPSARRTLMGPFAEAGSTTFPPWVITTSPDTTRRRAARRAGSIRSRQPSSETARAASETQIVFPASRAASSSRMRASRAWSRSFASWWAMTPSFPGRLQTCTAGPDWVA